jgi:outer membrane protein OmpU
MRETMKKILLASTALALSAGVAAAEVRLSGYARFGIDYDSTRPNIVVDDRWRTHNRFRLQVDVSTQTDTGLTFGARVRFQNTDGSGAGMNQGRFFATYEGLTVAFGNILGVIESMPNLYMAGVPSAGVGLTGNGFHSLAANTVSNGGAFAWTAYNSGGSLAPYGNVNANGVEAIYTFGDFTVHGHVVEDRSVTAAVIDEDDVIITPAFRSGSGSWALGARGTVADFTLGIGYERWRRGNFAGDNILFASAGYNLGEGNVAVAYARTRFGGVSANKWALKGGWNVTPDTLGYGFVARENNGVGTSYGIGASHRLGGGASAEVGYTRGRTALGAGTNVFSAGLFFSF